jgi:hypothetical protein
MTGKCVPYGMSKTAGGCFVLDVVAVLRNEDDYQKTRNYWKYLKAKLRKNNNELVVLLPR